MIAVYIEGLRAHRRHLAQPGWVRKDMLEQGMAKGMQEGNEKCRTTIRCFKKVLNLCIHRLEVSIQMF